MKGASNAERDPLEKTDHIRGPANAPIVIVEYGDFECPMCKQAAPGVEMLLEGFGDHIRFAYRHNPLVDAHLHALQAAQAAECADAQGKFWEMHALLFQHQTQLETNDLCRYAEQLDLDVARFAAELREGRYLERVNAHIASAQRIGIRSSPGFLVNGRVQDVSFGLHQLFDATRALLGR